jgi:alkylation response protein AidB-like acyl-CoA dehydrogenase
MTVYAAPVDELGFVLDHVVGLQQLPPSGSLEPSLSAAILAGAGRFAEEVMAPLNAIGDRHGAVLDKGAVRTAPGFGDAMARFAAAGWMGLVFPEAYGGQALPWTLNAAVMELWSAANMALQICPLLTQGAVHALLQHGSEAQRATFAPPLVAGRWTAAMCLTEPQAGSDLGAIRTTAAAADEPGIGPHFRLKGQKIYASFGEHDMAENIVHLLLARLPDAPPGPKGISLFIVPKYLPTAAGGLGRRNDTRCLKLERKLGIHAAPTCVMAYGDSEGAVGFLLGPPNHGLACMFTMMNNARLAVGVQGLGIAERAYQGARAYAMERVQGRRDGRPARLVVHPDIQRLLVGMRALCLTAFAAADTAERHEDAASRVAAAGRVALLTPLVKAWCTDGGVQVTSDALQVMGGIGYVEEAGMAQHYRDARILPIYEGTNGIQALDLVGRKLDSDGGQLPWRLFRELRHWPGDQSLRPGLESGLAALERATRHLQAQPAAAREAAAVPYLDLFSWVVGGFLLAKGAAAATASGDPRGRAWPRLARCYVDRLLPPAVALAQVVESSQDTLDQELALS